MDSLGVVEGHGDHVADFQHLDVTTLLNDLASDFVAQNKPGAIAQWTAQHREHIVLLRPGRFGLILHTLYYQDEIRAEEEFHSDRTPLPAR